MPNFTEQDYERLSAYIDGMLDDTERAEIEAQLQADADLRAELDALRDTVALVRGLPTLVAPRNFTLTPQMLGLPEKVEAPRSAARVMPPTPKPAKKKTITLSAVSILSAAASFILVLMGAVLLLSGGGDAMPETMTIAGAPTFAPAVAPPLPSPTFDEAMLFQFDEPFEFDNGLGGFDDDFALDFEMEAFGMMPEEEAGMDDMAARAMEVPPAAFAMPTQPEDEDGAEADLTGQAIMPETHEADPLIETIMEFAPPAFESADALAAPDVIEEAEAAVGESELDEIVAEVRAAPEAEIAADAEVAADDPATPAGMDRGALAFIMLFFGGLFALITFIAIYLTRKQN